MKHFVINTKTKSQYDVLLALIEERGLSKHFDLLLEGVGDGLTLVDSLEELADARGTVILGNSIPVWNHYTIESLLSIGINPRYIIASYELTEREISDIDADNLLVPIYGRIPLMKTKNCIRLTNDACDHAGGFSELVDRKNITFYVECDCENCQNIIYNSVPLSLHNILKKRDIPGCGYFLSFTNEAESLCADVLSYYIELLLCDRSLDFPIPNYTTAHFNKPVL